MYDISEKLGSSIINHGKYSDRIYLMKLSDRDLNSIVNQLEAIAKEKGYSKIFAKVPFYAREKFTKNGFDIEASIPGFYSGKEEALFLGKYLKKDRKIKKEAELTEEIIAVSRKKEVCEFKSELEDQFSYSVCQKSDSEEMARLYRKVFKTYPFPIHEAEYIRKTMDENIVYFSVLKNGKIVSIASSEMDEKSENVEMTDFATLPEYRGNGFATYLLEKMEDAMKKRGIKTAYTIARALSFGMNITFSKKGYGFSGTLVNNTNISGGLESMNVWYKQI